MSLMLLAAMSIAGCANDAAIRENARQLEQQKQSLEQMKTDLAAIKAAQHSYQSPAPVAGGCDVAVMSEAVKRGAERFAAGDLRASLGYYSDALAACPSSAQAEVDVGRVYERMGDKEQARAHYEQAISKAAAAIAAETQARNALARMAHRR